MPYTDEQLAKLRAEDKKRQKDGKPPVNMSTIPVEGKRPDQTRPQKVTHNPTPVGFKVPAIESPLPMRYFDSHKKAVSEDCCKDLDNLTVQYFKSNPDLDKPDYIIIECTCGRKHRRGAQGANA